MLLKKRVETQRDQAVGFKQRRRKKKKKVIFPFIKHAYFVKHTPGGYGIKERRKGRWPHNQKIYQIYQSPRLGGGADSDCVCVSRIVSSTSSDA